jgi:hypothetical protein
MVTAAHSDNGRNQLTCIEKDKPKNNNKIRQREKNEPIFQFLLSFFLVQPLFCSNNYHCDCHRRPSQRPPAMHAASPLTPLPPPPSIIILIVMIKIIISIHHVAASNTLLLPPPPPQCRRIFKCAAATDKITLPPSFRLRRQAGRRHRAPPAATSANVRQPQCYHCLQNKLKRITIN